MTTRDNLRSVALQTFRLYTCKKAMIDRIFITRVRLKNYRSIAACDVSLGSQQVGANQHPWRFLAASMSDGTLRALGNLVALFQFANGNILAHWSELKSLKPRFIQRHREFFATAFAMPDLTSLQSTVTRRSGR